MTPPARREKLPSGEEATPTDLAMEFDRLGKLARTRLVPRAFSHERDQITALHDEGERPLGTGQLAPSELHEIGRGITEALRSDQQFVCARSNSKESPIFHVGPIDECPHASMLLRASEVFSVLIQSWAIERWQERGTLLENLEKVSVVVREQYRKLRALYDNANQFHAEVGIYLYSIIETKDKPQRQNRPLALNLMLTTPLEDARSSLYSLGISEIRSGTMSVGPDNSTTFLRIELLNASSEYQSDVEGETPPAEAFRPFEDATYSFNPTRALAVIAVWTGLFSFAALFVSGIVIVFDSRLLNAGTSTMGSAVLTLLLLCAGIAFIFATRLARDVVQTAGHHKSL